MVYIYDLEVFPNFFLAGFLGKNSEKPIYFEISEWQDDSEKLYEFLQQKDLKMVGYNNLAYDYPIIDYILQLDLLHQKDYLLVTNFIFDKSQMIIDDPFSSINFFSIEKLRVASLGISLIIVTPFPCLLALCPVDPSFECRAQFLAKPRLGHPPARA